MMGIEQTQRSNAVGANTSYLPSGDPGREGGGSYSAHATEPTIQDYENFFGPSARDIKNDLQRFKRHGRWHLPDVLQGPNPWLTDRIDGLITDATNSPFTTKILPYRYKEDVDGKIKWNVWSFDEGMASRVPYEAAARTLTQSKRSFAGYMVRQGMAIVLEHNFMMTPKGRENFKNQLNQLIGSIQYTNDLDVHMALILAPSYQKTMQERYYSTDKSPNQLCREYADLFGMMQKNVNALDILIEEGKAILRTWGGPMPDFLLCNSKLTFQMTMTPEKTNYITQGIDGVKRLRQGPDLGSYRGLSIVHSRSFAMETGQHPRDVLRRRVRTAEYYRIPPDAKNVQREFELYNEERDTFFTLSFLDLLRMARLPEGPTGRRIEKLLTKHSQAVSMSSLRLPAARGFGGRLGAYVVSNGVQDETYTFLNELRELLQADVKQHPIGTKLICSMCSLYPDHGSVIVTGFSNNLVKFKKPEDGSNELWDKITAQKAACNFEDDPLAAQFAFVSPICPQVLNQIYTMSKDRNLQDILRVNKGNAIKPDNQFWGPTYLCFLECIKRQGLALNQMKADGLDTSFLDYKLSPDAGQVDFKNQFLSMSGACGSVNHPFHLQYKGSLHTNAQTKLDLIGKSIIITWEILKILLGTVNGVPYLDFLKQQTKYQPALEATWTDDVTTCIALTSRFYEAMNHIRFEGQKDASNKEILKLGISTMPMYNTVGSHPVLHLGVTDAETQDKFLRNGDGHLTNESIKFLPTNHLFLTARLVDDETSMSGTLDNLVNALKTRLYNDPLIGVIDKVKDRNASNRISLYGNIDEQELEIKIAQTDYRITGMFESVDDVLTLDLDDLFQRPESRDVAIRETGAVGDDDMGKVEIVIVRPNIEHNMLGIIMGLGGEELGNTLWGQTELSVYDDSMHGIWGMSYKYHERAIVFNEKNLIRLWDIAYDGYNGGKDDTHVRWDNVQSVEAFKEHTLNLGKNYRGASMMVMAFVHDTKEHTFNELFKRNWPSPIVFYDTHDGREGPHVQQTLPLDYDNLQAVDVSEFRVFNTELYAKTYTEYRRMMPDFKSMHMTRKSAGQSSADAETGVDCLAFQGTMRVKEAGRQIQEILGSGHHGPDYVGVASVRAGKGQKVAGQAPMPYRLI